MDDLAFFVCILAAVLWPSSTFAQSEGDVRLVGGSSSNEGRVEIYHNYQWGTVCDDYWDDVDATVVCKQLGFDHAVKATDRAYFGEGSGLQIYLDNVDCTGYESRLVDCYSRGWAVEDCSHSEDAGAICTYSSPSNGDIRLSDGLLLEEGRVEIYYNGVWGTICDDGWGYDEARVACYQLGYSGVTYSDTYYGDGNGPILLDDVFCYGWESALIYCYHDPWYSHNCGHNEDVGIRCYRSGSGMSGWLITVIVISSFFVCGALVAIVAKMCSKQKSKRNQTMQSQPNVIYNPGGNTITTTTTNTQPHPPAPAMYSEIQSYPQNNPIYTPAQAYPPAPNEAPPPSYTSVMLISNSTVPTAAPTTANPSTPYPPVPSPSVQAPTATAGATYDTVIQSNVPENGTVNPGFQS